MLYNILQIKRTPYGVRPSSMKWLSFKSANAYQLLSPVELSFLKKFLINEHEYIPVRE